LKIGLTENFVDIKDSSMDPRISYVHNPEINSRSSLLQQRKLNTMSKLKHSESESNKYVIGSQRLLMREEAFLRQSYKH
jgi:hypothetical protein